MKHMKYDYPTWPQRAEVLYNPDAPLSNVTGHYTTKKTDSGGECLLTITFHPWDVDSAAWHERLDAGPGYGPTDRELLFESCRESGKRLAREFNKRVMDAAMAATAYQSKSSISSQNSGRCNASCQSSFRCSR